MKSYFNDLSELDLKSILYVACLEKSNKSLDDLKDLDLKFHTKLIYSKYEDQIRELSNSFSLEELTILLLDNNDFSIDNFREKVLTDEIYKLLIDLLEIEEEDKIGDFQLNSFSKFEYIIDNKSYEIMDIYEPNM